ncbi:MAG: hypothetical protein EB084_16110 [Proteobacteria bacterium]|nr:hypothetical protein [Pseudomonadota bacterium]
MRRQFKDTVTALAHTDPRVLVLVGDISHFLFRDFQAAFPDRFYNLGICENTIISVAAGLSSQGYIPFTHTIAPFLTERSYEQIKLDLCYNHHPANIVTCGSSFDYAWDGATHHCYTDLAILRMLPHMEIVCPASERELDILLRARYDSAVTTYFRLSDLPVQLDPALPIEFGKGIVLRQSATATQTVVTSGTLVTVVLDACRELDVNVIYLHTIKPIDAPLLHAFAHTQMVVAHDAWGLHEAVTAIDGIQAWKIGLPDRFPDCYGKLENVRADMGLDASGIRSRLVALATEAAAARSAVRT